MTSKGGTERDLDARKGNKIGIQRNQPVFACQTKELSQQTGRSNRRAVAPSRCWPALRVEEGEMNQRNIRRVAAAAALVTTLVAAAPAQAASGHIAKGGPDWIRTAVHWVASLLPANWTNWTKGRQGIDPDGLTLAPPPAPDSADKGFGIDPDG
jgi:hypothetical protein